MGNKKNSRTHIQIRMNQPTPTTEVLDRADQQQGPQKTMVSTRRGVEVVTVNKQEMEALRKAAKEDAKKKRELEKMAQEQKRLQQELEKMQSALEAAKEREKNAATMAIIPTNRKIKKENLNDDLVQHTMTAAKTFLFRQTKFVEDIFQERELAEDIIPHLAVDLPISKEEFIDDYSGIVYNGIKAACTDVQSNAKKRAQGLCFEQVNIVFELPMITCKNLHGFF